MIPGVVARDGEGVLRRDGRAVIPPAPMGQWGNGRASRAQLLAYTYELQHQLAAVSRAEQRRIDELAALRQQIDHQEDPR